MATIASATTSTTDFKASNSVNTKRHVASSVLLGQKGQSDPNEARYWTQKFALGADQYGAAKRKYAQPREVSLSPVKASIAQQVLFGPPLSTKNPPLAVVGGPRVSLYGTSSTSAFNRSLSRATPSLFGGQVEPDRQIQTGGHLALCGSFRNDGRLMAVGTEYGEVRVCDVTIRATLSTFVAGRLPVRSINWFRNGQHIFAGGDDGSARVWNLSSTERQKPVLTLSGHGDVIRCTSLWQDKKSSSQWKELAITGSYDHTIRVWNIADVESNSDSDRCLAVLDHDAPVEALCLMKSNNPKLPVWLLSAGGLSIKLWNPVTGQCFGTFETRHRKTITSLIAVTRVDHDENDTKLKTESLRIMTGSLDGVLQVHTWNSESGALRHLHSTRISEAITTISMDSKYDRIAIGTASGNVLVKMRGPTTVPKKRKRDPKAGTYSFFQRGMNADAGEGDYTVSNEGKKRKLRSFDLALKQFRYSDALDDALATRRPRDVIAVLEELGRRRGLTSALANRDEELLEPILSFTIRYINKPHFSGLLIGIAHTMIDIYGDVAGQSEIIDELFAKLKTQISNECRAQKSLLQLMGEIDALMAASDT